MSPQNKHSINSPSPWHKPILHFINIYHLIHMPIQNLLKQFKSMIQQLYFPIRVWIKGSPFPLKIATNTLNIHSSSNLSLKKISVNVCQRFQTLIAISLKQFYSNHRRPTCFPSFHLIHCTMHLFNINSPHCTLYLTSILQSLHSFSTFINFSICSFQIFFRPCTFSFNPPLSSLRQLTPATSFFSPTFCLVILIFFLMSANHSQRLLVGSCNLK